MGEESLAVSLLYMDTLAPPRTAQEEFATLSLFIR